MKKWILLVLGLTPLAASAQVNLDALDRDMTGSRAEVLVLGTVHLSELGKGFKPASLAGVLDRLAAFRPEIITIEDLPGAECAMAAQYPEKYGKDYCRATDAARAATGLDIPAALGAAEKILKTWPAKPTPEQRRHLTALFLAANDRASALVQWLQLPEAERHRGDGLDDALVALLGVIEKSNNENYQLAARLAARLGLPRVYPVDNHTGDAIDVADIKAFEQAVIAAWKAGGEALKAQDKQIDQLAHAPDLLALYRLLNEPGQLQVRAEGNVSSALSAKSPEAYPRIWVAGWEIRNLRMVANIRESFRERPDARVLSIVGATHKPWFDNWLGQFQGVDIVDVEQILK